MHVSLDRVAGCLLGCAVGDALGLPHENLSARRLQRRLPTDRLVHGFLWGRGLVSDDTEHCCMVGQCLLEVGDDPEAFGVALARRLRWWFLAVPPGIGLGTLRAMIKLCVGFGPDRSGVWTAGNGPAMRTALLGVCVEDPQRLDALVRVSTRITHTDPRAEAGARVVAVLARALARDAGPPAVLARDLADGAEGDELRDGLGVVADLVDAGAAPADLGPALGLDDGISGYINHTVPAAVGCALLAADAAGAIEGAIRLGGDTDTVAAIAGSLAGARFGAASLPTPWIDGLAEWPRDVAWMRELAQRLVTGGSPLSVPWWVLPPRNLAVGIIAIGHILTSPIRR